MRDISKGTAGDLLAYLDSLGTVTQAPWPGVLKSATRQVFLAVDGREFAELDVTTLDVDQYLERFIDDAHATERYAPRSLSAYQSRFRSAIDIYLRHLADPHWLPPAAGPRSRTSISPRPILDRDSSSNRVRSTDRRPSSPPQQSARDDSMALFVTYPFPLKSGQLAQLRLPPQLDADDAARLTAFIRALVLREAETHQPGEGN